MKLTVKEAAQSELSNFLFLGTKLCGSTWCCQEIVAVRFPSNLPLMNCGKTTRLSIKTGYPSASTGLPREIWVMYSHLTMSLG
jgi:hypothetical protein